jgi:hypothetical protein
MVLVEEDGITTMTVTSLYRTKEARDGALQTGMEQGAEEGFQRLDELLAGLTKGGN